MREKLKVDARTSAEKCAAVLCRSGVVGMRRIWNIFSDRVSTATGDISKMKNSSKSNFRPPPHCGCEANVSLQYFDMHFVFTEIESNAIARHYSSLPSQSSPRCRSRKRIFLFFLFFLYIYGMYTRSYQFGHRAIQSHASSKNVARYATKIIRMSRRYFLRF